MVMYPRRGQNELSGHPRRAPAHSRRALRVVFATSPTLTCTNDNPCCLRLGHSASDCDCSACAALLSHGINRRTRRETTQRRRPFRRFRDRTWARLRNPTACHRSHFPAPARGRRQGVRRQAGTRTRPGPHATREGPMRPVVHSVPANLSALAGRPKCSARSN